jgi:PhoD-like phosphatase
MLRLGGQLRRGRGTRLLVGSAVVALLTAGLGASPPAVATNDVTVAFVSDSFGGYRAPSLGSVRALNPRSYFIMGDWDHSNPGTNLLRDRPDLALARARSFFVKLLDPKRGPFALDYVPLHDSGIPAYRVMDDHEVNNDVSITFQYWPQWVQALGEAYPPAPDNGYALGYDYQSVQVDRDLYVLLDLRTHRENRNTYPKSILGNDGAQKTWLTQKLAQCATTGVRWCVIVSTVPLNPLQTKQDSWSGYVADRAWFFNQVATSGAKNVIVVSGDCHWGSIAVPPLVTLPELNISQTNTGFSNTCSNNSKQWTLNSPRPDPGFGSLTLSDSSAVLTLRNVDGSVRLQASIAYR